MDERVVIDVEVVDLREPLLEKHSENDEPKAWILPNLGERVSRVVKVPVGYVCDNGLICVLFSQALYSILGILMKLLVQEGMTVFQPFWMRGVVSAIMCWAVAKATGQKDILGPRNMWKFCFMMSLAGNIGVLLFFEASILLPAGDAMAISRLSPVFAVIYARLLGWEKVNFLVVFGGLTSSVGGVLIAQPPFLMGVHEDWNTVRIIGLTFALMSAILTAFCYTTVGKIGTNVSSLTLGFWSSLAIIPLCGIPIVCKYPAPLPDDISQGQLLLLFAFVICAFIAYISLARGVQLCNGVQGTSLQPTAVIFSYALGYEILHESVTILSMLGTLFILLGVSMASFGKGRIDAQS